MQKILYTNNVSEAIESLVKEINPVSVHIITDENVERDVLARLALPYPRIVVKAGDEHKNIASLSQIWAGLIEQGATRHSLVINIGGGVITDMGGFAAATYKRGIKFINVPTTLLSAVDAAVGGKTGINFEGFKNEIGAFAPADAVVISTILFATLPREELLSGYAEMIKHGLLSSEKEYNELLNFHILDANLESLLPLLEKSVKVKERIVEEDPKEHGIRRALNLGHTAGHAFEGLALERDTPMPHGYAVAYGMLVEMILSHTLLQYPSAELYRYASYLKDNGYGAPAIDCKDYDALVEYMRHDKKNLTRDTINFTLLASPGNPLIDRTASESDIRASLDIFRDLMGI
ncbi:MAG: 3-dehydroquinate synthase [Muribaculaceae bacterium]|nr:3-dehydroquinate synthase [Muribaculaceae bacterium]